jgi:adenylosuccinate lyase
MDLSALTAISPVDGRYRNQVHHLDQYFSEFALIRYRVLIEIEYFIALSEKKFFALKPAQVKLLREIYLHFTTDKATEIKNIEKITNHDVKAVEYYLKQELDALKLGRFKEWIHFGLTSQDVNNTAIPLLCKESL